MVSILHLVYFQYIVVPRIVQSRTLNPTIAKAKVVTLNLLASFLGLVKYIGLLLFFCTALCIVYIHRFSNYCDSYRNFGQRDNLIQQNNYFTFWGAPILFSQTAFKWEGLAEMAQQPTISTRRRVGWVGFCKCWVPKTQNSTSL